MISRFEDVVSGPRTKKLPHVSRKNAQNDFENPPPERGARSLFRTANVWMPIAFSAIGIANIIFAERVTVSGGFGWDGLWYADWTRNFYESIFVRGVPEYYVPRILPSAIVHYGMRILGVPITDHNLILAFDVLDLALIVLCTFLWGAIADRLSISTRGKWFGFCLLFLNYAILKSNFYQPVLTDTSAFALGFLTLYFYLSDRPVGLLVVIILGAFTWQTVPYMAALLYIFPKRRGAGYIDPNPTESRRKLNVIVAGLVSITALVITAWLSMSDRYRYFDGVLHIDWGLLWLSLACMAAFLFLALRSALSDSRLFDFREWLIQIRWKRALVAGLIIGSIRLLVHYLANGVNGWEGFKPFAMYTALSSVSEPLLFLVAHVVYYGPAIILLILLWRPFCKSIEEYGIGLRLVVIINVILAIHPQSRYQINVVAIFVVFAVKLLDRSRRGVGKVLLWTLLCLIFSKVWYTFNTAPQVYDGTMNSLLDFPLQHFFMNSGPWMSHGMYLLQGAVVLGSAAILYLFIVRTKAYGCGCDEVGLW
jgi:hypothetical protein